MESPKKITVHTLNELEARNLAILLTGEKALQFHVYDNGAIEIPLAYGCIHMGPERTDVGYEVV